MNEPPTFTAFDGHRLVATGPLERVARALADNAAASPVQIFDDASGRPIELDMRSGPALAVAEYLARTAPPEPAATHPGRGRPRLGVVAREITLLPRHWDWLATQSGGASAALRRLVEDARRASHGPDRARTLIETTYRAMSVLAGDLPGFEDASRALFAGDTERLGALAASWPEDVRTYVLRLSAQP